MRWAAVLALVVAGPGVWSARAELVRGTIKVDVRDASGAVREAPVVVRPRAGGEPRTVARAGDVYVAEGLLDGEWIVEVTGATPEIVRVDKRRVVGVVAVLGAGGRKSKQPSFTVGPGEPACDAEGGAAIEAIAFAHGGLGAGRLEVQRGARVVCAVTIAGGGASLRLVPGDYTLVAQFVGGGRVRVAYHFKSAPPPLVLRAR